LRSISETLFDAASNYLEYKKEKIAGHSLHKRLAIDLPEALKLEFPDLIITGSIGKGNWADIPWLALLHPLVTSTPQEGFYPVYLIDPEARSVVLSLNQGVTEVERGFSSGKAVLSELSTRAQVMRDRCGKLPYRLSQAKINLHNKRSKKARQYTAAHAYGRTYDTASPLDGEQMLSDLRIMIQAYNEIIRNGGQAALVEVEGRDEGSIVERKKMSLHQRYDRMGNIPEIVKDRKGYICEACSFDFEQTYGELGSHYIEAHHLKPFKDLVPEDVRYLDPIEDFAVLCANCHRMIHRQEDPSDLQALIAAIKKGRK